MTGYVYKSLDKWGIAFKGDTVELERHLEGNGKVTKTEYGVAVFGLESKEKVIELVQELRESAGEKINLRGIR